MSDPAQPQPVPWRTILASVATVAAALLAYVLLREMTRILAWLVVAGFFALVLSPAVDWVQTHLRLRRGLATSLVFFGGLILLVAMLTAFIVPVAHQVTKFSDQLPRYVEDARNGKGPAGDLIKRYDLDKQIEKNRDKLQKAITGAGAPALKAVRGVFNTLLAFLTILVLTFLMLLRGPGITAAAVTLFPPRQRQRVRLVAADAAKAVSGYMLGNFLISLIAGIGTYVLLKVLGVPYPEVIALFVAFADLIPLVGATLGAIPTVGLSFIHSTTAGVVALVFYVVYQQFENHVLQPSVMSRTVDVNPLAVLVSVLVGVELFGFLGALLAIPAAGILQVVIRNVYDPESGRFKREPTVGESEQPISQGDG
ncbi:MAG: family transporter [Actinomycetia bacterium]|nr:family transporter [Actinomycetes bacterium]